MKVKVIKTVFSMQKRVKALSPFPVADNVQGVLFIQITSSEYVFASIFHGE